MDVSVLICTHNSYPRLERCIDHLLKQNVNFDIEWEVIIADYLSKDNTLTFINSLVESSNLNIRLVCVEQPGKTPAIEAGFYSSKGEIICIVDDDNLVSSNYVQLAYEIMNTHHDVGVVGARGIELFSTPVSPPRWFSDFREYYAVGKQLDSSGYTFDRRFHFWGAGSIFRKSAWLQAKQSGFVPRLNPSRGDTSDTFLPGFSGGEDPEMCYAVIMAGYKLWYEDNLLFHHLIPQARLSSKFLINTTRGVSVTAPYLRLFLSYILKNNSIKNSLRIKIFRCFYAHLCYIFLLHLKKTIHIIIFDNFKFLRLKIVWTSFLSEVNGLFFIKKIFNGIKENLINLKSNLRVSF